MNNSEVEGKEAWKFAWKERISHFHRLSVGICVADRRKLEECTEQLDNLIDRIADDLFRE